jgi:uncharacterized coiled-coil DUF342 family protein
MQPLQQDIKKELIKHPFRNIEIVYETGKTILTAQDEELIAGYIRLHDFEHEMKTTAEKLNRESVLVNETLEELREQLKTVRATFDNSCELADKLSEPTYSVHETSLQKLAVARQQTEEELKDYHDKLLAVYETAKVIQDEINEYHDATENQAEALYEEFSGLVTDHAQNWENNTVNIVDFDRQFDQFREFTTAMESYKESLVSESESAMTNYTNLNNESTALYNVWNEFIKRTDLLAKMADLQNNATGFTEN